MCTACTPTLIYEEGRAGWRGRGGGGGGGGVIEEVMYNITHAILHTYFIMIVVMIDGPLSQRVLQLIDKNNNNNNTA